MAKIGRVWFELRLRKDDEISIRSYGSVTEEGEHLISERGDEYYYKYLKQFYSQFPFTHIYNGKDWRNDG